MTLGALAALMLVPTAAAAAEPVRLVGMLTEQGDQKCGPNMKVAWVNLHFQVGFVPLVADATLAKELRRFEGQPVVVEGAPVTDYTRPAVKQEGECPIPQMRSDWVWSRTGMRQQRAVAAGPAPPKALKVTSVKPYHGILAAPAGADAIQVRFRHALGKLPMKAKLVAHYEGCFGKPGTKRKSYELGSRDIDLSIAKTLGGVRGRTYRLDSLQVLSPSHDGVHYDMDLGLHRYLGIRCPPRGKKPPAKANKPHRARVQFGASVLTGFMAKPVIRKALGKHAKYFLGCYADTMLRAGSTGTGVIELKWRIHPEGRVMARPSVVRSTFKAKEAALLQQCVIEVAYRIPYPKPKGGGLVQVKQPIVFMTR